MSNRNNDDNTVTPFSMKRWKESMDDLTVRQEDLDKLVLEYLVVEGYADVARTFNEESGCNGDLSDPTLDIRSSIRESIEAGNTEAAIDLLNNFDPNIMDSSPLVVFRLQQLRLIDLIRAGNEGDAIEFAQQHMAPHGRAHPELLPAMEESLALLAFPDASTSPLKSILSPDFREIVASQVNAVILQLQYREAESRLEYLMKVLVWGQRQLGRKARFPTIEDLTTAELIDPETK